MFVDRTRCCSAMSVIVVTIASALDSNRFLLVRMKYKLIGHFLAAVSLIAKARLSAKLFI